MLPYGKMDSSELRRINAITLSKSCGSGEIIPASQLRESSQAPIISRLSMLQKPIFRPQNLRENFKSKACRSID